MSGKYHRLVRALSKPFPCGLCGKAFVPNDFQKHFAKLHKKKNACTWCCGKVSWKPKNIKASHLLECFGSFLSKHGYNINDIPKASESEKGLTRYIKRISRCKDGIKCPRCGKEIQYCNMEIHFKKIHNLKNACVWCNGDYTWKGRKQDHVEHMTNCYEKFKKPVEPMGFQSIDGHSLMEFEQAFRKFKQLHPTCKERNLMGRNYLPGHRIYEDVSTPFHLDTGLTFRGNLQIANQYVHQFVRDKDRKWYHVMVSAAAYDSFLEEINKFGGVNILPFWCLCDGSKYEDPKLMVHKHMILFTNRDNFIERCWRKIQMKGKRPKNYNCKRYVLITDRQHLINVMLYVSNKESRCVFPSNEKGKGDHHYWINKSLLDGNTVRLSLSLVGAPGGLQRFMTQLHGQKTWIEEAVRKGKKWCVPVSELMKGNIVLPVSKHWRPTGQSLTPSDYSLHLMGGKYLNFVKDKRLLRKTEGQWIELQMNNGNNFYKNIDDDWYMSKHQQKTGNYFEQPMKRLKKFDQDPFFIEFERNNYEAQRNEMERLKARIDELEKNEVRLLAEISELKNNELERLKARILELEATVVEYKERENRYISENNELKNNEIKRLNARILELEATIVEYKKINKLKDEEIERLKKINIPVI